MVTIVQSKSKTSLQTILYLVEETNLILNCLKEVLEKSCDVFFGSDISSNVILSKDNSCKLPENLSGVFWNQNDVRLKLKSDINIEKVLGIVEEKYFHQRTSPKIETAAKTLQIVPDAQIKNSNLQNDFENTPGSPSEDSGFLGDGQAGSIRPFNEYYYSSIPKPIQGPQGYTCPQCNLLFTNVTRYKYHHQRTNDGRFRSGCRGFPVPKKPKSIRKNGRYYCGHPNCLEPESGEIKDGAENWRSMTQVWKHFEMKHAVEKDLAFKCKQCDKGFTTPAFLNTHIKEIHEHKFSCKFCSQTFGHRTGLSRHELRHFGHKPFKCNLCDYAGVTSSLLKRHNMTQHINKDEMTKNHVCDQCGKAFLTRNKLDAHIVTHSDKKNYLCQHCGKYLKNDSSYRRHMVGIHKIKFTCDCCGKDFSSFLGRQIHQRDVHHIITIADGELVNQDTETSSIETNVNSDGSQHQTVFAASKEITTVSTF